ncbi:MAG: 4Fe-4S single cluster domain-containing protein, partial [Lachnospiraceae bacterium]
EPLEPENQRALLPFVKEVKKRFPEKSIWCYTGNVFDPATGLLKEQDKNTEVTEELISLFDVLVDGEFIEAQKNIRLKFRGSSNQRILDVKKSKISKSPVFYLD